MDKVVWIRFYASQSKIVKNVQALIPERFLVCVVY